MSEEIPAGLPQAQSQIQFQFRTLKEIEKQSIMDTLVAAKFNATHAAVHLGISRPTLYRKMKSHSINRKALGVHL